MLDLAGRASTSAIAVSTQIAGADLSRPTPCATWNVAALLAHMTGLNRGFAAAARGWGANAAAWAPVIPSPTRPGAAYADSVHAATYSLVVAHELRHRLRVPSIDPSQEFSASTVAGFYLVDTVAHGWDLARACDLTFDLDDEVVGVAGELAALIPGGEYRLRPDALFAPRVEVADAEPLSRFLGQVGRSPHWTPISDPAPTGVHA
jgi:uncharacterized protein (TIGR03086 family)